MSLIKTRMLGHIAETETQHRVREACYLYMQVIYREQPSSFDLNQDDYKNFASFLGDPFDGKRQFYVDPENPKIMEMIDIINGPNGRTYLKMLQARNMQDTDP